MNGREFCIDEKCMIRVMCGNPYKGKRLIARKYAFGDGFLARSCQNGNDFTRVFNDCGTEGEALVRRLRGTGFENDIRLIVQIGAPGKQACGVAIVADAEKDGVKDGKWL